MVCTPESRGWRCGVVPSAGMQCGSMVVGVRMMLSRRLVIWTGWVVVLAAIQAAGSALTLVGQTPVSRAVGYANMRDSDGIAFVPGSRFGAGQADRLVLVKIGRASCRERV